MCLVCQPLVLTRCQRMVMRLGFGVSNGPGLARPGPGAVGQRSRPCRARSLCQLLASLARARVPFRGLRSGPRPGRLDPCQAGSDILKKIIFLLNCLNIYFTLYHLHKCWILQLVIKLVSLTHLSLRSMVRTQEFKNFLKIFKGRSGSGGRRSGGGRGGCWPKGPSLQF